MANNSPNIDLSTGKVAFSQPLAAVYGPSGFGEQLALQYSTHGLIAQVKAWNQDSPTGIAGLGWQLPLPIISRLGNGSRHDRFLFNGSRLLPKSPGGAGTDAVLEFETIGHSMSRITYQPATETWTVVSPDGTTSVFGGVVEDNGLTDPVDDTAVDWGIRWAGTNGSPAAWVGSSIQTGNQQQYALIWRLRYKQNVYGQRVDYRYDRAEQVVGSSGQGLRYTVASYLAEVKVHNGGRLLLVYGEKASNEYPAFRYRYDDAGNVTNAFQDRISTRFLQQVTICDVNDTPRETVLLGYDFLYAHLDYSYTEGGETQSQLIDKRLLVSLEKVTTKGTPTAPSWRFDYWGLHGDGYQDILLGTDGDSFNFLGLTPTLIAGGTAMSDPHDSAVDYYPLLGHLKSVQEPAGGVTYYSYQNSCTSYAGAFSVDTTDLWKNQLASEVINYPDGAGWFTSVWEFPQAVWGDDFVVIQWNSKSSSPSKIHLDLYEWTSGSWVKASISGYNDILVNGFDSPDLFTTAGAGMFAVVRTGDYSADANQGAVILFSRDSNVPGNWTANYHEPTTQLSNNSSIPVSVKASAHLVGVLDRINGSFYGFARNVQAAGMASDPAPCWNTTAYTTTPMSEINTSCAFQVVENAVLIAEAATSADCRLYVYDPTNADNPWPDDSSPNATANLASVVHSTINMSASICGNYVLLQVEVQKPNDLLDYKFVSWSDDYSSLYVDDLGSHSMSQDYTYQNPTWSVCGNTFNYAEDGKKWTQVYRGGSGNGWLSTSFDNTNSNSDPLPQMAIDGITIAAYEEWTNYDFTFYEYDTLAEAWNANQEVSEQLGHREDWDEVFNIVSTALTDLSLMLMLFPPLDLVASAVVAPVSFLFSVSVDGIVEGASTGALLAANLAKTGTSMALNVGRACLVHQTLDALYSGRRDGLVEGFDYLIVGVNANQPGTGNNNDPSSFSKALFKSWDPSTSAYTWSPILFSIDHDNVTKTPGGSAANDALTADVFAMGSQFAVFSYRCQQFDLGNNDNIMRTDQICYFQNGLVLQVDALPQTPYPSDYQPLLATDSDGDYPATVAYSILASQDQTFPMYTSWGAVLGYLPTVTQTLADDRRQQNFFSDLYFAQLFMVQDAAMEGPINDYVVDKVGTDDGFQTRRTFVQYAPQEAYLQKSLGAVVYNQVRVARDGTSFGNAAAGNGWTESYFYTPQPFYGGSDTALLPYDPASDSAAYATQNASCTNVASCLNLLAGKEYCQRQLKSQDGVEFSTGYEVKRQVTFYKSFQRQLTDSSGNSIGLIPTFGALSTLHVSLSAPATTFYSDIADAYAAQAATQSLHYRFYDLDGFRSPSNPADASNLLTFTLPGSSVPLNTGEPYADLTASFELAPDGGALTRYAYTQQFLGATVDSSYQAFWDLNLLRTVQRVTWQSSVATGPDVPSISPSDAWSQANWQQVSNEVQTWSWFADQRKQPFWHEAAGYRWNGPSDGSQPVEPGAFPWTSPPASGAVAGGQVWLAGGQPSWVESGTVLQSVAANQTQTSRAYDKHLLAPVFEVSNSELRDGAACYLGFEAYEANSGIVFYNANRRISRDTMISSAYSLTGNRSVRATTNDIPAWVKPFQADSVAAGQWLASITYLVEGTDQDDAVTFEIRAQTNDDSFQPIHGDNVLFAEDVPLDSPGVWRTEQYFLDLSSLLLGKPLSGNLLLVLDLAMHGSTNVVYIDSVSFAPVEAASFRLQTRDSATGLPVARATPADYTFGERSVYNRRRREIAKVKGLAADSTAAAIACRATGYSRWATPVPAAFGLSLPGSYASIDDAAGVLDFDYDQDFSVSFWMRGNSAVAASQVQYLVSKILTTAPYSILIQAGSQFVFAERYDGSQTPGVTSTTNVLDGDFHHIAFVRRDGYLFLYVDGIQEGTTKDTTSQTTTNTGSVNVGIQSGNAVSFDGIILELRIWNYGRSQSQICSTMNYRLTGLERGLVGYWPLNNQAADLSVSDQPAEVHDCPYVKTDKALSSRCPLSSAQAVILSGATDQYVTIADSQGVLWFDYDQDFSVECWVRQDGPGAGSQVQQDVVTMWSSYYLQIHQDSQQLSAKRQGGSTTSSITCDSPFVDGQFHHLAFVRRQGTLYLYVDGQLAGHTTDSLTSSPSSDSLTIGDISSSSNPFAGAVMELRVWKYGRRQEEIVGNMRLRLSGLEPGLVGYWPFSGQGDDLSPNRQDASLTNCGYASASLGLIDLPHISQQKALHTNGHDHQYVTMPDDGTLSFLPDQDFTIEGWFNVHSSDGGLIKAIPLGYYLSDTVWELRLESDFTDGNVEFKTIDGAGNLVEYTAFSTYPVNKFFHLAVVRRDGTLRMYLNGTPGSVTSSTSTTEPASGSSGTLSVNGDAESSNSNYNSAFDVMELRIWGCARSQEEIARQSFVRLTGEEEHLLGYWPFDNRLTSLATSAASGTCPSDPCSYLDVDAIWIVSGSYAQKAQNNVPPGERDVVKPGPPPLNQQLRVQAGQTMPGDPVGSYFDFRDGSNPFSGGTLHGRTLVIDRGQQATASIPGGLDGMGIRVQLSGFVEAYQVTLPFPPPCLPAVATDGSLVGLVVPSDGVVDRYNIDPAGTLAPLTSDGTEQFWTVNTGGPTTPALIADSDGLCYGTMTNEYQAQSAELYIPSGFGWVELWSNYNTQRTFNPDCFWFPPTLLVDDMLIFAIRETTGGYAPGLYNIDVHNAGNRLGYDLADVFLYSDILADNPTPTEPVASPDGNSLALGLLPSTAPSSVTPQVLVMTFDGSPTTASVDDQAGVLWFDYYQDFTVELWLRYAWPGSDSFECKVVTMGDGFHYSYYLGINASTPKVTASRSDGINTAAITSNFSLTDGDFHQLAFVRRDGILSLYIDGQLEGQVRDSLTASPPSGKLFVGDSGQDFSGDVAELRIWNYGRTQAQIQEAMNHALWGPPGGTGGGTQKGLVGYWPFDGDATDASKYQQNASVYSGSYSSGGLNLETPAAVVAKYDAQKKQYQTAAVFGSQPVGITGGPVLAVDGSVILATDDNRLHAFDADMTFQQRVELPSEPTLEGLTAGGVVAAALGDGTLRLYDTQLNLLAPVAAASSLLAPPVIHGDAISVLGKDGTGKAGIFTYNTAGQLQSPPYPVSSPGTTLFQSFEPADAALCVVDTSSSTVTKVESGVPSASLAIGAYRVSWDASSLTYTLTGTLQTAAQVTVQRAAGDWLLMIANGILYFHADGQLIFAEPVPVLPSSTDNFEIAAGSDGLAVRDVVLLQDPTLQASFRDGCGSLRQVQKTAEVSVPSI